MPEGGEGHGECGLFLLFGRCGRGAQSGQCAQVVFTKWTRHRDGFPEAPACGVFRDPLSAFSFLLCFEGSALGLRSQEDQGKNGGGDAVP